MERKGARRLDKDKGARLKAAATKANPPADTDANGRREAKHGCRASRQGRDAPRSTKRAVHPREEKDARPRAAALRRQRPRLPRYVETLMQRAGVRHGGRKRRA